jgi:cytoskeletal protein CcmA (bactofilin family)
MGTAAIAAGGFSLGAKGQSAGGAATYIGEGVVIAGDLKATGEVVIAGAVKGQIIGDGRVVVLEGGAVEGPIRAVEVVISGGVKGDITASASLSITATAIVRGDLSTARLIIEPGASFAGRCMMPEVANEESAVNG